jgi:hypothetical protein
MRPEFRLATRMSSQQLTMSAFMGTALQLQLQDAGRL